MAQAFPRMVFDLDPLKSTLFSDFLTPKDLTTLGKVSQWCYETFCNSIDHWRHRTAFSLELFPDLMMCEIRMHAMFTSGEVTSRLRSFKTATFTHSAAFHAVHVRPPLFNGEGGDDDEAVQEYLFLDKLFVRVLRPSGNRFRVDIADLGKRNSPILPDARPPVLPNIEGCTIFGMYEDHQRLIVAVYDNVADNPIPQSLRFVPFEMARTPTVDFAVRLGPVLQIYEQNGFSHFPIPQPRHIVIFEENIYILDCDLEPPYRAPVVRYGRLTASGHDDASWNITATEHFSVVLEYEAKEHNVFRCTRPVRCGADWVFVGESAISVLDLDSFEWRVYPTPPELHFEALYPKVFKMSERHFAFAMRDMPSDSDSEADIRLAIFECPSMQILTIIDITFPRRPKYWMEAMYFLPPDELAIAFADYEESTHMSKKDLYRFRLSADLVQIAPKSSNSLSICSIC